MNHTETFTVAGLAIRTTNENQQAAQDIPALWQKFMAENTAAKIENKADDNLYCVYTDYESDFTRPYTTLIGCKVERGHPVPEGLEAREIPGGNYELFTARGKLDDGIVIQEWIRIWNSDLERVYGADFEVYSDKSWVPDNAEVDIFIGIK